MPAQTLDMDQNIGYNVCMTCAMHIIDSVCFWCVCVYMCTPVADEVDMATEDQLAVEGGEDSASDEASSNDDHTITSTSTVKTKVYTQPAIVHQLMMQIIFQLR